MKRLASMPRFALAFLALAGLAVAAPKPPAGPSNAEVAARNKANELAGAWANDGFKVRDAHITGNFTVGQPKVIRVNLFAGNQYWFSLAAAENVKKVAVHIFDENGKPVTFEKFEDGSRAAAGFAPTTSGLYLLKVELLEGDPSAYALLYSYR
jgi:hypothetical protein